SPFVAIDDASAAFEFSLTIDGTLTQAGHIELMIYNPQTILEELQSFTTLEDGDIVMTGTPKGVGIIPLNRVFKVALGFKEAPHQAPLVEYEWQSR
ncbi:MAG: fumarylacetoacetate hydrolase family protein, partial [Shewanella sp.]